jgi:hypothetical protein
MPAMARGRILDRVVRTLGSGTDVIERLTGLPASDLRALLLEVAARRADTSSRGCAAAI